MGWSIFSVIRKNAEKLEFVREVHSKSEQILPENLPEVPSYEVDPEQRYGSSALCRLSNGLVALGRFQRPLERVSIQHYFSKAHETVRCDQKL